MITGPLSSIGNSVILIWTNAQQCHGIFYTIKTNVDIANNTYAQALGLDS